MGDGGGTGTESRSISGARFLAIPAPDVCNAIKAWLERVDPMLLPDLEVIAAAILQNGKVKGILAILIPGILKVPTRADTAPEITPMPGPAAVYVEAGPNIGSPVTGAFD